MRGYVISRQGARLLFSAALVGIIRLAAAFPAVGARPQVISTVQARPMTAGTRTIGFPRRRADSQCVGIPRTARGHMANRNLWLGRVTTTRNALIPIRPYLFLQAGRIRRTELVSL